MESYCAMWDGSGGFKGRLEALVAKLKSDDWSTALQREAGEGGDVGRTGVDEAFLSELCRRAREELMNEAAFVEVEAPIRVCGDTHGQYADLLKIFRRNGWPPESRYIFLGDYVDRGPNSMEVITMLLSLKLLHPASIWLLRGNHEASTINRLYGFLDECKRRYSESTWRLYSDVFNCLPFCGVVEHKILCMHGGLSSELKSWEQLRRIRRPCDVPDTGLLCDLLWADPEPSIKGWMPSHRGVSFKFGPDIVKSFCDKMGIDLVARAHQVMEDGYEFFADQHLVTVFSAPNYCGEYENAAAVMKVDADLVCSFDIIRVHGARRVVPVPPAVPTDSSATANSTAASSTAASSNAASSNASTN